MKIPMRIYRHLYACLLILSIHAAVHMTVQVAPGDLDPTFGLGGKVIDGVPLHSRDDAYGVAVQADGKIVVAGSGEGTGSPLARYHPDGSLDTTFDMDGHVISCHAQDVAIQVDGKIIVGCIIYN